MIREIVHLSGPQAGVQGSEQVQLLLINSEPYIGYVFFNAHERKVIEWKIGELISGTANPEEAYQIFIQSSDRLASWNQSVQVISFTGRQTMVPASAYQPSDSEFYASLQFVHTHEDQLLQETNTTSNSIQIYAQPKALSTVLDRFFPLRMEHHFFHLLLNQRASEEPVLRLSILPSQCILTAQMHQQWYFLQTFSFEAKEDILYFLLQLIQQLGKEPSSVLVQLEGLIDKNSSLTKLLEQYLPQIQWGNKLVYEYPETSDFEPHTFSFIDSVLTCVS